MERQESKELSCCIGFRKKMTNFSKNKKYFNFRVIFAQIWEKSGPITL